MKIKIDRQLRLLGALKDRVKDQVAEMQRLEVREQPTATGVDVPPQTQNSGSSGKSLNLSFYFSLTSS